MTAELRFAEGHTGRVRCSMGRSRLLEITAHVSGNGRSASVQPVTPSFSTGLLSVSDENVLSVSSPASTRISSTRSPGPCCAGTGEDHASDAVKT